MMNLLKDLKQEQIEALADLYEKKEFKVLRDVLKAKQKSLAWYLLKPLNFDITQDVRWEASAYSKVIELVSQAYKKINKE